MKTAIYDLAFEITGDNINLEQSAGYGEMAYITLHSSQLRLLAERAGLLDPVAITKHHRQQIDELERRLSVLADKIQRIVCDKYWRGEILERMGDGLELIAHLDALCDLAIEFDGGRLTPDEPEDAKPVVPLQTSRPANSVPHPTEQSQKRNSSESGTDTKNGTVPGEQPAGLPDKGQLGLNV